MKLFYLLYSSLITIASAQTYPECTAEVARTDDCAAVINANACYNKFRWNSQTLMCIDGDNNAVKQRQVCACCSCVGKVMCDWATKQKFC
ncbi:hypothetical protein PtrSN002B_011228 [Pyrenophora tritici-repentis]|uniref:Uncharacterized protein n=1 Tax=Pyrenophora tritici-repentis TaxID=45151 RepID=A0A5M9KXX1_9PLEO|nr:hypothetical protein PtrV1_09174 [Pyrenophora tritici-repentis]KAF7442068.1 hypothetical protein A1F99_139200 [Pyrenophora tritici-repentis]KAF7443421.1 hypothetical protein A1F99_129280 [Pyrenophora tritici-repentis]KAI0569639.1 hypothetical protein Alg215_11518 [Pyrenophora tritici-repentis]KAI1512133.1 hypothetical protein Ptr86124_008973 [Pyrenophora tritici-repentis]